MTHKEYNGWHNYETWAVALWLDNEQGSQEYVQELAQTAHGNNELDRDAAVSELEDVLKEMHEENLPELQGFAADLLNAAMSEVNWHEIAESIMDDACETFDLSFEPVADEERSNGPRR